MPLLEAPMAGEKMSKSLGNYIGSERRREMSRQADVDLRPR